MTLIMSIINDIEYKIINEINIFSILEKLNIPVEYFDFSYYQASQSFLFL